MPSAWLSRQDRHGDNSGGFGSRAIGGSGWAAWAPQDDEEAIGAIKRAVELGINWIDTATVYGLGHSEELVARILKGDSEADRPYVFTKCSLVWDNEANIFKALKKDSVKRLGYFIIGIYFVFALEIGTLYPSWVTGSAFS